MSSWRPMVGPALGWLGPAAALGAGALLLFGMFRPDAERGLFDYGAIYTVSTYDQALALVGIGVGWTQMTARRTALGMLFFAGSLLIGLLAKDRLVSAILAGPGSANLLLVLGLIGPICCVVCGLGLVAPARPRGWLMPLAAAISGLALGFFVALDDPSDMGRQFIGGAVLAACWLLLAPPALLWPIRGAWLRIGGRIFASWLIAIGVMLGASKLVAVRSDALPPAPDQTAIPQLMVPEGEITPAEPDASPFRLDDPQ
jgi:hypothetical protein